MSDIPRIKFSTRLRVKRKRPFLDRHYLIMLNGSLLDITIVLLIAF